MQLSFRKTEKNLEETEVVELDEELVRLRNENGTLLERLTRLSSQLESCGRCQMSTIENELQVLRTEKASIQDKLLSTECEVSTLKNDLEAATCALLDQLEAQVCRLKYSGTKNDHGVFIEEVSTGSIDKDASSIDNFGVPIDSLENELISMEIFHEDEWALYGGTLLEQSNEITWLSSGSGEVGADALKVAKKRTLESSTLGTKLASSFDVRKGFSGIEDFVQSTQKRTLLLEVENVHYKKQLVKLENVWSKVKQVEYDGLVQSLRIELQNMERHFADSVVASGDALFHVRRRFLLFAIEKRGWLLEKTWYEDSLRHAHEDIERLKRNETEISTALSERDHDISVLDAKVASLEIQRNDLSFEVGEMASCMHDLAVEKEEITASFLLALQKLHALHIEKSSLSRHFADTRGEIGSMEIESHEKIRKNDALERSSQAQQTDISLRKSLLKNLFKANVNVVILQQTNECQRIQHQKDKEQMLLKMARMSMSSGEIHKENSALRRKLLTAGNAKARCKADNAPLSRREIEREQQLAASRLDVAKLQTSQIELQELLEQSTVNMQVACIQVAFLKEAIEELERKAIPHMVCTVYPENVDFEAVFASESYRPNDFQLASLQLTERVLARRIVPMKILSLRHWHSFAVAKCLLHESRRKSFAVTKELMQAQIKIGTLIASRKAFEEVDGAPMIR